ncbi:protein FAR1-RELATED SEQUENCE 5-like [Silene latifolia]|uniref:protein FAR1-RELATED SEQUENCE 5-like n=1 Tax=Silene latifolia TaxID=37657 RepID=UPI003D78A2CC
MSDPTSNVTSSSCNDIHVSAITSKDSNDILESSIISTVLIEPPDASSSTPHVEQHSVPSRVHQLLLDSTPGGSELWTRNVAPEFKPYIGQLFGTLKEAISFYDVYAEACGFEPRKSSQKGFRDRKRNATVLDSGKEKATPKPFDIRNTKLTRIGCTDMIEFRYNGDGYVVFQFREWVNQGPTRAFKIVKEYVDGYENVGAQLVDFKNFGRDIKCFIGDWDAQLFVNYFEDKRDTTEGFYFAYEVDSGKCLVRVFWCDAESRRNYALFGDYITYDPTYSTNKYCMLFTPFTGVDHHKRSVTFASALLFHEDEDSFTWVFQKFLDAMGQREPHCIITDQCAGIKLGLRAVFKHAKRRYCMWHIMQKLSIRLGCNIERDRFCHRLNAIVWDL